jgi:sulfur relay (sulfurtransferase) complex TusBCD TusD component (DsrE family)
MAGEKTTVLVINRAGMGHADPELARQLIKTHLRVLLTDGRIPAVICLYADGVKLACEGSPVIDELRDLAERGSDIAICSTCLDYFGLRDKVQVGVIGSMPDIVDAQWRADKVITL